ncbi:SAF domain-containing protein [Propionicimonas paludicola]|uniref:SAF domain-containing protein n=1 Tax=Propionicimonas paludicola TaxID=185243 RepID=A0A2A9CVA0_9ACTN|nr:SAF domain-containing protein [Propionicimonas paludicola]PFG18328.1 SAF domain-containing protein [Propionicimonas paludicola]
MAGSAGAAQRPRRNVRWIAAGVLAVCLGTLGAALLWGNLSQTEAVVIVKRTVYRDQVITATDLGVTSAAPAPGVATVAAERLAEVIGRTARTDLAAGTLLHPEGFGEPLVGGGQVLMGLRLPAGRLPSMPLPPGTAVLLVPVTREAGQGPDGPSVTAQIATAAKQLPDGAALLDVTVGQAEAERVAKLAAADQLSLLRVAETGQ